MEELQNQLAEKDGEIRRLREQLSQAQSNGTPDLNGRVDTVPNLQVQFSAKADYCAKPVKKEETSLTNACIARYSRQLILPEIGVKGQLRLKNSSVLIVGAGGLGCPSAVYLAAAGIGRLGVVDYDEVELSNLHRQILHTTYKIGVAKSLSVTEACQKLNNDVEYIPYRLQLSSDNALELIKGYDIVLDATDNVATRYLLNDACVMAGKPLVSGSALRFEGQLTVYNCNGGPCYRCLFPKPPPPETVTNCSDGGVLGVVPGIIGSLQALEALKIASGIGTSYSQRLLLFDGLDGTFRTVKLRAKAKDCVVCGVSPSITQLVDYEQFCGAAASDKDHNVALLDDITRISAKDYECLLKEQRPHLLVDVRPEVELQICRLPHPGINIPVGALRKDSSKAVDKVLHAVKEHRQSISPEIVSTSPSQPNPFLVVCVCKRGNDSQLAVLQLQKALEDNSLIKLVDIRGGLSSWAKHVDTNFPVY